MIYIALAVILIIFILCAPVKLAARFHQKSAFAKLYVYGVPIYKLPPKKIKETAEKPQDKVKEIEKKSESLGKKIKHFASLFKTAVKLIKKYVKCEKVELDITVGTGDAPTTAISTGVLWASVYTLLGIIGKIIFIDKHNVQITPDYANTVFNAKGECIIKSRIVYIIIIAITILRKIYSFKEE